MATNLPKIAITVSAALAGRPDVAGGNILGGIAIQTAVLVVLDVAGVRPRAPLTRLAGQPGPGAGGDGGVGTVVVARLAPASVLVTVLWVVGLLPLGLTSPRLGGPSHPQPADRPWKVSRR